MSTTAKIAAKGCNNTGITEQIAKRYHDQLGKTGLAIIEFTSDARTETKGGDEQVKLAIGIIEVVPDGTASDHVRELARLFNYERRLVEDGDQLDYDGDGPAPKVADVLAHGQRFEPHPFLPVDASEDNPICDVCGQVESTAVHADRTALGDPFATTAAVPEATEDEDQDEQPEDANANADEWEYPDPDPQPAA